MPLLARLIPNVATVYHKRIRMVALALLVVRADHPIKRPAVMPMFTTTALVCLTRTIAFARTATTTLLLSALIDAHTYVTTAILTRSARKYPSAWLNQLAVMLLACKRAYRWLRKTPLATNV